MGNTHNNKKRIRLLYLSTFPKSNISAFSGMNLRLYRAFSELDGYEVDYFEAKPNPVIRFVIRSIGWLYRKLTKKDLQSGLEELYFPSRCRAAWRKLSSGNYDGIIAWQPSFGRVYKRFAGKKIYISDSTYHALVPYYEWKVTDKQFDRVDASQKMIFDNLDLFMSTSIYFNDDAVNYYGLDPSKLRNYHYFPEIVGDGYRPKQNERLELLIVGSNFKDKGIPFAIEVLIEINRRKPDFAHLTILGPKSTAEELVPVRNDITFVNDVNQFDNPVKFKSYYEKADIYIGPSRHECAGVVFTEAASFGLPVVAFATGGIPGYVMNQKTGFLLPPDSSSVDFANIIIEKLGTLTERRLLGTRAWSFFCGDLSRAAFLSHAQVDLSSLFKGSSPSPSQARLSDHKH